MLQARAVLLLLLISIAVVAAPARAAEYVGKVVGISDGDTLTLLTADKQQIKVRLGEIDTPEARQPYGNRARQALSDLAFGKQARIVVQDTDRYGRTVGRVYVGNVDVNAEMVRQGAAWVYRKYAKDQRLYALEDEAKAARRGLWGLPEADRTPPWEWRQAERGGGSAGGKGAGTAPAATSAKGFTCGSKKYCKEMASCEEANFYLKQCGVSSMDGDGDGTPCETLCK